MGVWVIQIPTAVSRTGISSATLGWLLLSLGVGALGGMTVLGRYADRLRARITVPASAFLCALALFFPLRARNWWELGLALVALGISAGALDISMNTHAIHVEREYHKPVMSMFHAVFSVGGFSASVYSAQLAGSGLSSDAIVNIAVGVCLAASIAAAFGVLPKHREGGHSGPRSVKNSWRKVPRHIWALSIVAMAVMVSEGIANDWSSVYMHSVRHASPTLVPYGYGAFAAMMTVGRGAADRISHRFSSFAVVRYGALIAFVGIVVVIFAPTALVAIWGWATFGAGLSGCVPQVYSAVGHFDRKNAAVNVSRVAGVGYFGMLAGPMVIGQLTKIVSLQYTFLVPAILCLVALVFSPILREDALLQRR
ncbi:MAG: MFS transporter [Actinomycetota bacterium]|nr:MFS transporter [Actinomycetota bacterium]